MTNRRTISDPPKKCSVKSWIIQDWKDMVFSPKNNSEINMGVIEEEYATSINDKLARKNYLNEFSVLLMATVTTMSRLPTMVGV